MAKYKIGVTEAGDAGLDLSWQEKLGTVDGAVVITKCVSPAFYKAVLANKDKLIVHATITGYGHSVLEPNVPAPYDEFDAIMSLVEDGFPKEKVVIRVDPIIPTAKGLDKAKNVITTFMDEGFSRFRVSIIDMYKHVKARFKAAGLPLPYGEAGFAPSPAQVRQVDVMLREVADYWQLLKEQGVVFGELRIECCAEPGLKNAIQCGCISAYDLVLLGLSEDAEADGVGYQRPACMCYSGKMELLCHKQRCAHGCLYCYWH